MKRAGKSARKAPSFKLPSRKIVFTKMYHTVFLWAPKKDQLNFLEMKVRKLQASVSIRRYRMDVTRRQANLRSQIWYPKIGKNRSREGWARAEEKLSIRMQES